jgi:hypothetical protein
MAGCGMVAAALACAPADAALAACNAVAMLGFSVSCMLSNYTHAYCSVHTGTHTRTHTHLPACHVSSLEQRAQCRDKFV